MTTDMVLQAILRAPQPPTELAMESAGKVLDTALDGFFPTPEVEVTPEGGVALTWATMSSELVFNISPIGKTEYRFENRKVAPFGVMSSIRRQYESGDVTDPREGTLNLLIWLLADETAQA